jgi:small conductance mechanosensitive channel
MLPSNGFSRVRQCWGILLCSALLVLGGASGADAAPRAKAAPQAAPAAPEPAPAASPSAPSPARRALEQLNGQRAEVLQLRRALREASGERKEVSFGAVVDGASRYRRELDEMASEIARQRVPEGAVDERDALVSRVGTDLEVESTQLSAELRESQALVRTLVEATAHAQDGERAAFEKRRESAFRWMATLIGGYRDNLAARTLLGQDTSAELAKLKPELTEAAAVTHAALRRSVEELAAFDSKGADLDAAGKARRETVGAFRTLLVESQRKNIAIMDEYGLDTVQLRQDLITTTGEVSQDILDAQVLGGLLGEWKTRSLRWASENASAALFRIFSIALILVATGLLARLGRGLVRRGFARATVNASTLASEFFVAATARVIWLLGFVVAAGQLGIEIAPLLAGLGIAGFVAGFALQDTLSNFAAGMMILVYRPFDVGDVIEAGGVTGAVQTMTLVYTAVLTPDNQMLIIPNNKIWGGVIRNVTRQSERRVDLEFNISYRDDIAHAERLLLAILSENTRVLREPAALVRLHELGESSAKFVVRPWVKTADYWDAYWEITREVKRRFDLEGLSVPFPRRELHIVEERGLDRAPRDSQVAPAMSAE